MNVETRTKHGGKREGAGREPKYEEPVRLAVTVEKEVLDRVDAYRQLCRETGDVPHEGSPSRENPSRGDVVTRALTMLLTPETAPCPKCKAPAGKPCVVGEYPAEKLAKKPHEARALAPSWDPN